MPVIRRKSYELLADEFSRHRNIDDTFSRLRETLDNPELLEILVLLDSKGDGHLENILKKVDSLIASKAELEQTLNPDLSDLASSFFLRLVNLKNY